MLSLIQSDNLNAQFEKQYAYEYRNNDMSYLNQLIVAVSSCDITLPRRLNELKLELNETKSKLSYVDIFSWHKHTSFTNPAGTVVQNVRRQIAPELCTQAWCKFYDLLSHIKILPIACQKVKRVKSLHLCEAPGAFITSLNHYLKLEFKDIDLDWVGVTLNPYYEGNDPDACIVDDRLIYLSQYRWCFGSDNTGDILNKDNVNAVFDFVFNHFDGEKTDIVTADGSINCQENPAIQEIQVQKLLYTELYIAMRTLNVGGSFIIKTFTLFDKLSVLLVFTLATAFKFVTIRKPSTSKSGNSEVYIVATEYKGFLACETTIDILKTHLVFNSCAANSKDFSPIPEFPREFLQNHLECVEFFCNKQIQTIEDNLSMFSHRRKSQTEKMQRIKAQIYAHYKKTCNLEKISNTDMLLTSPVLCHAIEPHISPRSYLTGSFDDRKFVKSAHCLKTLSSVSWMNTDAKKEIFQKNLMLVLGKKIERVYFSLFCRTDLLEQHPLHHSTECMKTVSSVSEVLLGKEKLEYLAQCLLQAQFGILESEKSQNIWEHLAIYLKSSMPQSISQNKKFNVLVSNISSGMLSLHDELYPLLQTYFQMLNHLEENGHVILLLPLIVRRSSAAILRMFQSCFTEMMMFPLILKTQHSVFNSIVLCCRNYAPNAKMTDMLSEVKNFGKKNSIPSNFEILQVVSVKILLEDNEFLKILKKCNEVLVEKSPHFSF